MKQIHTSKSQSQVPQQQITSNGQSNSYVNDNQHLDQINTGQGHPRGHGYHNQGQHRFNPPQQSYHQDASTCIMFQLMIKMQSNVGIITGTIHSTRIMVVTMIHGNLNVSDVDRWVI